MSDLSKLIYKQKLIEFPLPSEFFQPQSNGESIIFAYGTVIDPLSLIAEILLELKHSDLFHLQPSKLYESDVSSSSDSRVYGGAYTALNFESCFDIVQR